MILEIAGFNRRRQSGSHVVMQGSHSGRTWTVVVPLHPELAQGTLASIIRQSGLPKDRFLAT